MPQTKPLTPWQITAANATEGACLLPYLLALLGGVISLNRAPYWLSFVPISAYPLLLTAVTYLLYSCLSAPLRLWRVAVYVRLCQAAGKLPSLRPTGHAIAAIGWQWRVQTRRILFGAFACLPSALLFSYGAAISSQSAADVLPALCLLGGVVTLLIGITVTAIRQCRYSLAALFILRGESAVVAMALSARAMRGHIGEYINFLGAKWRLLLPCLLLFPALRCVPVFRQQKTAFLLQYLPPDR